MGQLNWMFCLACLSMTSAVIVIKNDTERLAEILKKKKEIEREAELIVERKAEKDAEKAVEAALNNGNSTTDTITVKESYSNIRKSPPKRKLRFGAKSSPTKQYGDSVSEESEESQDARDIDGSRISSEYDEYEDVVDPEIDPEIDPEKDPEEPEEGPEEGPEEEKPTGSFFDQSKLNFDSGFSEDFDLGKFSPSFDEVEGGGAASNAGDDGFSLTDFDSGWKRTSKDGWTRAHKLWDDNENDGVTDTGGRKRSASFWADFEDTGTNANGQRSANSKKQSRIRKRTVMDEDQAAFPKDGNGYYGSQFHRDQRQIQISIPNPNLSEKEVQYPWKIYLTVPMPFPQPDSQRQVPYEVITVKQPQTEKGKIVRNAYETFPEDNRDEDNTGSTILPNNGPFTSTTFGRSQDVRDPNSLNEDKYDYYKQSQKVPRSADNVPPFMHSSAENEQSSESYYPTMKFSPSNSNPKGFYADEIRQYSGNAKSFEKRSVNVTDKTVIGTNR